MKSLMQAIIIAAVGVFFMLLVPVYGETGIPRHDIAAGILTGLVLVYFIQQAYDRKRQLLMTVYLELNKLRRIYHLSKNLSVMDQKFRVWFTDLHGYLCEYMNFFSENSFRDYSKSNAAFRKVSYHIYKIPEVETNKENALFNELLRTAAMVAESRQHIKELRKSRLPFYAWVTVIFVVAGFIATVYVSTVDVCASRLTGAVLVAIALLAVNMLWELDSPGSDAKDFARRYVNNIGKLQLEREEK